MNFILTFLNRFFRINTAMHTEYGGPGRVWCIRFFRGAGYCVVLKRGRGWDGKPRAAPGLRLNISIRGFTFYWRTAKSRRRIDQIPYGYRTKPVKRWRLTTNPNQPVC